MTGNQLPPTELLTTLGWLVEVTNLPRCRSYHSVLPGMPDAPINPLMVENVGCSSQSAPTSPHDQTIRALSFRKLLQPWASGISAKLEGPVRRSLSANCRPRTAPGVL